MPRVRRPGVLARPATGDNERLPWLKSNWVPGDNCDCLWFSRSSESTFALLPFGPFFCGMALYVHVKPAEIQFLQGFVPSPMHFTLRLWQLLRDVISIILETVKVGGDKPVACTLDWSGGGGR